jgi:hypothetical protein
MGQGHDALCQQIAQILGELDAATAATSKNL